jgi:hypothetical protein
MKMDSELNISSLIIKLTKMDTILMEKHPILSKQLKQLISKMRKLSNKSLSSSQETISHVNGLERYILMMKVNIVSLRNQMTDQDFGSMERC